MVARFFHAVGLAFKISCFGVHLRLMGRSKFAEMIDEIIESHTEILMN